jgi:hypothetical protein
MLFGRSGVPFLLEKMKASGDLPWLTDKSF